MKIAYFTESYHPVINGVTRSIDTLVGALEERGHQAIVYAPDAAGQPELPGVRRFPSYYLKSAGDYPLAIPFSPRLFREFAREQFDVVHIQTPFALGLCGFMLARWHRIPLVAHMHTLYTEYVHYFRWAPEPVSRAVLRRLLAWFYSKPDAVVVPSEPVRRLLQDFGVRRSIQVVPTGVGFSSPVDRDEARQHFGLPLQGPVLLYTGRLAREKNIGLLLESFAQVHLEVPSSRLLILGTGPAASEAAETAVALQISKSTIFAGLRPHEDVIRACSAADLYIFPSSTDTQALSVVEAMSCGVPAVVVNAYGPAEIVQNGRSGVVVESNAAAISAAALSLLRNPDERYRLAAGARLRALDFSIESTTAAMIRIYEEVLAR